MKVEVRPINLNGRPMRKAERESRPSAKGSLKVSEIRLNQFGRNVRCARVVGFSDEIEKSMLPDLMDVELLWADGQGIRLSGIEEIDGCLFAQTWDVRVMKC